MHIDSDSYDFVSHICSVFRISNPKGNKQIWNQWHKTSLDMPQYAAMYARDILVAIPYDLCVLFYFYKAIKCDDGKSSLKMCSVSDYLNCYVGRAKLPSRDAFAHYDQYHYCVKSIMANDEIMFWSKDMYFPLVEKYNVLKNMTTAQGSVITLWAEKMATNGHGGIFQENNRVFSLDSLRSTIIELGEYYGITTDITTPPAT